MFVVATATFQLLYALIVLSLDRRRVHFEVTQNPTQVWLSGQMTEAFFVHPMVNFIQILFATERRLDPTEGASSKRPALQNRSKEGEGMVSAVRNALIIGIFVIYSPAVASSMDVPGNLNKIYSPWIEGDTLYIKGTIDSHIYDYLALQAADVAKVRVIDLNSFGGNSEWAMNIAKKIVSLDKDTRLGSGHVCASACVFLYAAGKRRIAAADTWIGIHGVRLGAGFTTTFEGVCFTELETAHSCPPKKAAPTSWIIGMMSPRRRPMTRST